MPQIKTKAKTVHRAFSAFCCCPPFARPQTHLLLCPFCDLPLQNEGTTGPISNSCHVMFFKCSDWECCDHVQSNQQMLIVSFYRIFFFSVNNWGLKHFRQCKLLKLSTYSCTLQGRAYSTWHAHSGPSGWSPSLYIQESPATFLPTRPRDIHTDLFKGTALIQFSPYS